MNNMAKNGDKLHWDGDFSVSIRGHPEIVVPNYLVALCTSIMAHQQSRQRVMREQSNNPNTALIVHFVLTITY